MRLDGHESAKVELSTTAWFYDTKNEGSPEVWTAPWVQERFGILTGGRQRSCVRPHMRAFSSSYFVMRSSARVEGYRGKASSKAELSSAQDLPANLTSGGTLSPPRSRIRDGRAPGERHHSIRRHARARPDNGDAPLDPWARAAPQPRPMSGRSDRRLHDRPLRQHALSCEPPQSDQESPRQSHDHHLAHTPSGAAGALAEPAYLGGPWLVALP